MALSRSTQSEESLQVRQLSGYIEDTRFWLYEQALPFWSRVGVDGDWGFVEHLGLDGQPADVSYKRLFVQARQVYVFSHASCLGYVPGLDIARSGWRFMCEHGWRTDGGGWAHRLGRLGGVIDPVLNLYDQAFALLAIAWWTRASGDTDALSLADLTLAAIDDQLASPNGVGWLSETGPDASLLQNPHMHLLEALLALYATTGEQRFKARLQVVLDIFDSALFDPTSDTLAEYYDDEWHRIPGEPGKIVEPGHHYEWVWLLHQAESVARGRVGRANALFEFAERFGHNPATGLIYDEVLDDGSVRTASHRCWPHTEALKAQLARFESEGALDVARTTQLVNAIFNRFLRGPEPGTWIDRLDERGGPRVDRIPTSTFYHLFLAFAELLRLEPLLREAGALE